ncbi:MAG: hypothetical protein ACOYYS_22920 [Chloroflexota bacterium]
MAVPSAGTKWDSFFKKSGGANVEKRLIRRQVGTNPRRGQNVVRQTHRRPRSAAGKLQVLTGLLQEKYGYTRKAAANEIGKRLTAYEANTNREKENIK